jgi:hypothetical protein
MPGRSLTKKIADIICFYRNGEFGVYDHSHVERWASQFDAEEKTIVLEETYKILKRNFITKETFIKFVDVLIDSGSVYKNDKDEYWKKVSALDIQQNGNSQSELNDIFASKISEQYGVNDLIGKISDEYIYLDDFIFSGNRLYSDMSHWIVSNAPVNCRVCIITIGWYLYGQWSTDKKLKDLAKNSGKSIDIVFASFTEFRLENRLFKKDYSEVFWPTASVTQLDGYSRFLENENFTPKYRIVNGVKNNVFSNSRRDEYEKILFKYGLKIMSFPSSNSSVVKPLGYSTFKGFGFGSTIFTFRNCPNNNPLVFWWGDPTAHSSHPFSNWYPLLQRKAYGA